MNDVEDRLTGALAARAEQVQPEDLSPVEVPPTNRWRRPAGLVLVAAACAALISIPFLLGGGAEDDSAPADRPPQFERELPGVNTPAESIPVGKVWEPRKRSGYESVTLRGKLEFDGMTRNPELVVRTLSGNDLRIRLRGLADFRLVTTVMFGGGHQIAVERTQVRGDNRLSTTYDIYQIADGALRRMPQESQVRQYGRGNMEKGRVLTHNFISARGFLHTWESELTGESPGPLGASGELWVWDTADGVLTADSFGSWCRKGGEFRPC